MLKLLVDKSQIANHKYYVKCKIRDRSPMENHFIQLIKNKWPIHPEGWVYAQYVFNKKVARCDKNLFSFCVTPWKWFPGFLNICLKLGNILKTLTKNETQLLCLCKVHIIIDQWDRHQCMYSTNHILTGSLVFIIFMFRVLFCACLTGRIPQRSLPCQPCRSESVLCICSLLVDL